MASVAYKYTRGPRWAFHLLKPSNKQPLFMQSSKGFTLIELVAVISIISIMLFLTLPRFNFFSQTNDIRGVSRWLMATIPQLKSKAISEQKPYILIVDLDKNTFLIEKINNEDIGIENISDEESDIPESKEYKLSQDVEISDILYPERGIVLSGQSEINFYTKGYSDRAIIHIKDDDNNRLSFLVEPFLNRIFVYSGHLDFTQILLN